MNQGDDVLIHIELTTQKDDVIREKPIFSLTRCLVLRLRERPVGDEKHLVIQSTTNTVSGRLPEVVDENGLT